jgi:hypothetical protein
MNDFIDVCAGDDDPEFLGFSRKVKMIRGLHPPIDVFGSSGGKYSGRRELDGIWLDGRFLYTISGSESVRYTFREGDILLYGYSAAESGIYAVVYFNDVGGECVGKFDSCNEIARIGTTDCPSVCATVKSYDDIRDAIRKLAGHPRYMSVDVVRAAVLDEWRELPAELADVVCDFLSPVALAGEFDPGRISAVGSKLVKRTYVGSLFGLIGEYSRGVTSDSDRDMYLFVSYHLTWSSVIYIIDGAVVCYGRNIAVRAGDVTYRIHDFGKYVVTRLVGGVSNAMVDTEVKSSDGMPFRFNAKDAIEWCEAAFANGKNIKREGLTNVWIGASRYAADDSDGADLVEAALDRR